MTKLEQFQALLTRYPSHPQMVEVRTRFHALVEFLEEGIVPKGSIESQGLLNEAIAKLAFDPPLIEEAVLLSEMNSGFISPKDILQAWFDATLEVRALELTSFVDAVPDATPSTGDTPLDLHTSKTGDPPPLQTTRTAEPPSTTMPILGCCVRLEDTPTTFG